MESPQKKKAKQIVINTIHCRSELDTVQYVIDKCGFKETTIPGEGNILWLDFMVIL